MLIKSILSLCSTLLLAISPVANAAEYVYSKKQGHGPIGIVELHQVNSETVNLAPLCGQYATKVILTRIHSEGTVLRSFEGRDGGEMYFFTVEDFYGKFPNATRAQFKDFMKPGAKIFVLYQECGRSPIKHPLTILFNE